MKMQRNEKLSFYDESSEFDLVYSKKAIGKKLRDLRKNRGLASFDLANEAEIHPSYYSHLETGRNCVSVKKLGRICEVFGVSLSSFFKLLEDEDDYMCGSMKKTKAAKEPK